MSTTILTRQKVEEIATVVYEKDHFTPTDEVWCNLYWLTKFAEAIEQAVLQSEQVQAWKRDAERYRWLRSEDSADIVDCLDFSGVVDGQELDAVIDAAMEKQL